MTKSWIFRADKSQFCKYFEAGTKYPYFKIKMYSVPIFLFICSNIYSGKKQNMKYSFIHASPG